MKQRKGIVLAGGSGTRLYPLTRVVSKQLMPIYDKPMIYYPLSLLMLADIREILIISSPDQLPLFRELLGTGEQLGLSFQYVEQAHPEGLAQAMVIAEAFLDGSPSCLVLGDNLFYAERLTDILRQASLPDAGATIFGYWVANPEAYGVVGFDENKCVTSLEEKPETPRSNYAIPGLYFYDEQASELARGLKRSARGELEITDLNRRYLEQGQLKVQLLGRGTAWLDTGTHSALLEASNFVQTIEKRQGLQIACLEEIALDRGWVTPELLESRLEGMGKTDYTDYIRYRIESRKR